MDTKINNKMNQKINTWLRTMIIIIIAITASVFIWEVNKLNPIPEVNLPSPKQKIGKTACTMEAKLCPDGSYVSRSGPNCEFAPCPEESVDEISD